MLNIDIPALHFYVDEDNEIVIEEMEVMPDHVHVLISFPPSEVPTSAIKALKDRNAFIFLASTPGNSEVPILGRPFMIAWLLH